MPDLVEDTHQLILHVIGTVGHEAILVVHAYPCVVVEVAEGLGIRGGVFGAHLVIPADLHVIKGALALVPRRCPEADKAVSAKIVTQRVGDLGLTVSVKDGHVVLVLDDEAADELLAAILLEVDRYLVVDGIVLNEDVAHIREGDIGGVHLGGRPARDETDTVIVEGQPDAVGTRGAELIPLGHTQTHVGGHVVHGALAVGQQIQLDIDLLAPYPPGHIEVAMLGCAYHHAVLEYRGAVVAPIFISRKGGTKVLLVAVFHSGRGISGHRPADLEIVEGHLSVVLMGPYRHVTVLGDIVAELGGGLHSAILVGDGHVLAVGDGYAEDQSLGSVLIHIDRNDIIRLVILYGDGAGLGEVKAALEEGNIRPTVDDTDSAALEGQPDTVLSHSGKLIVILGKAEGDIARVVGDRPGAVGLQIHRESDHVGLGLVLEGKVGMLVARGGQVSLGGVGHLVDRPVRIICADGLGEVLGILVMLIGLGLGSLGLGLGGDVVHEIVGLGLGSLGLGGGLGGLLRGGIRHGGSLGFGRGIIPAAGGKDQGHS